MEIPGTWNHTKRQKTVRNRNESQKKKPRISYDNNETVSIEEMCRTICENVLNAQKTIVDETLKFDSIMSFVPYRQILETIFGNSIIAPEFNDIPIVSKIIEENFMREPLLPGERKCVLGNDCECRFIDKENPFTGVEFLVGNQTSVNCEPQMCVLCTRKHTQRLFYDFIFKPPMNYFGCIQRYGVLTDVPNEYSSTFVLIMPPNGPVSAMPFPSPIHCRNNYKVTVRMAKRYIVQTPESNFQ
jgi:hypothetical protein